MTSGYLGRGEKTRGNIACEYPGTRGYPDHWVPRLRGTQTTGYPDQRHSDWGYPDLGYPYRGYPNQTYPDNGYPEKKLLIVFIS